MIIITQYRIQRDCIIGVRLLQLVCSHRKLIGSVAIIHLPLSTYCKSLELYIMLEFTAKLEMNLSLQDPVKQLLELCLLMTFSLNILHFTIQGNDMSPLNFSIQSYILTNRGSSAVAHNQQTLIFLPLLHYKLFELLWMSLKVLSVYASKSWYQY